MRKQRMAKWMVFCRGTRRKRRWEHQQEFFSGSQRSWANKLHPQWVEIEHKNVFNYFLETSQHSISLLWHLRLSTFKPYERVFYYLLERGWLEIYSTLLARWNRTLQVRKTKLSGDEWRVYWRFLCGLQVGEPPAEARRNGPNRIQTESQLRLRRPQQPRSVCCGSEKVNETMETVWKVSWITLNDDVFCAGMECHRRPSFNRRTCTRDGRDKSCPSLTVSTLSDAW